MSLSDRLTSYSTSYPGPKCVTGQWVKNLKEKDLATYQHALDEIGMGHITVAMLYKACRDEGLRISRASFYRHVHQECNCALDGKK